MIEDFQLKRVCVMYLMSISTKELQSKQTKDFQWSHFFAAWVPHHLELKLSLLALILLVMQSDYNSCILSAASFKHTQGLQSTLTSSDLISRSVSLTWQHETKILHLTRTSFQNFPTLTVSPWFHNTHSLYEAEIINLCSVLPAGFMDWSER